MNAGAALSPAAISALLQAALAAHRGGRLDEAAAAYDRVLAARPAHPDALNLAGVVAMQRGDPERAAGLLARSVAAHPGFADSRANLGSALRQCGRMAEARGALDAALALRPDHVPALVNRAAVRRELGDFAGAAQDTEQAFALAPGLPLPPAQAAADRAQVCDWSRRAEDLAELRRSLAAGEMPPAILPVLALCADPALHRRAGELLAPPAMPAPPFPQPRDGPVRIGYFSGELGDHATGWLIAEALERHDPSRCDVSIFAWNARHDGSPVRERLRRAAARFIAIDGLDDAAAAALARERGIDIAVDLDGYTRGARPGIFAHRAAPVQAAWLGYPGTTGADWCDYLIADPVIAPMGCEAQFSEAVVRLPHCYQPRDRTCPLPAPPTRAATGPPEQAFVLACFAQPYKIGPELFAGWLDLLRAVPGSVLWLLDSLPQASANLRHAAAAAGLAPERLTFAPRLPLAEHLARLALADLALDTAPFTGHTTTSDALWAGVPVVGLAGTTFAGRVSASVLTAAGLPDLVAASAPAALALARDLAADPGRLAAVRLRVAQARNGLAQARHGAALFDTAAFTAGLEAAYGDMHARRRQGLAPAPITVSPERAAN